MSTFERIRRLFRRPPVYRIDANETEFRVTGSHGSGFTVSYAAISSVTAYKIDLLTLDLICFAVSYLDPVGAERSIQVDEDMDGFTDLEVRLVKMLEGFERNWRGKVVQPAFAENRTLLFQKRS